MTTGQLPRGRRGVLATVVALIVLAACVLVTVAAFQVHAGRDATALGHVGSLAHRLHRHDWHDSAVLSIGVVAVVVGLVLALAGVLRPAHKLVQLTDTDPDTIMGIARPGLQRDLASVASSVDGVTRASVSIGRSRVTVRATSALRDRSGVDAAVTRAVDARLVELAPVRAVRVQTRVGGKAG